MYNSIVWPLLLQLFLIVLNAIFACTEIAVLSLNEEKYRRAYAAGDKRSKYLVALMGKPARFLATIQVGITLAGFLASAFAAENFSDRLVAWLVSLGSKIPPDTLDTICVIVITLVLSYFTLVFGELVPKRIAMQRAEKIAKRFGRAIYYLSKAAAPIVWLLTASTNGVLRLLRIDPHADNNKVTEEEIRILVDIGEEKGTIAPEEGEMIDNVFELGDRTAAELMTPRTAMSVVWMKDDKEAWRQTICDSTFSRYPVCGDDMDDIRGILHVRDLLCGEDKDKSELLRTAHFVPETAKADAIMREMRKTKSHMSIVVDEYGGMSGVVTLEDVLEEIVGEIEDEHDDEAPYITEIDGGWRVRGDIDIELLAGLLGVKFPVGDYDTLGGLIFAQMHRVPMDGAQPELDIAGVNIKVTDIQNRRVEWAQVRLAESVSKKT